MALDSLLIPTELVAHELVQRCGEPLVAGQPEARCTPDTTLVVDSAAEYVLTAERRPVGWLGRRFRRAPEADVPVEAEQRR